MVREGGLKSDGCGDCSWKAAGNGQQSMRLVLVEVLAESRGSRGARGKAMNESKYSGVIVERSRVDRTVHLCCLEPIINFGRSKVDLASFFPIRSAQTAMSRAGSVRSPSSCFLFFLFFLNLITFVWSSRDRHCTSPRESFHPHTCSFLKLINPNQAVLSCPPWSEEDVWSLCNHDIGRALILQQNHLRMRTRASTTTGRMLIWNESLGL